MARALRIELMGEMEGGTDGLYIIRSIRASSRYWIALAWCGERCHIWGNGEGFVAFGADEGSR